MKAALTNRTGMLLGVTVILGMMVMSAHVAEARPAQMNPWVVYGEDDRKDLNDPQIDPFYLELAQSTAALVRRSSVSPVAENPEVTKLKGNHFGSTYRLCEDEPFREQTSAGFCSGFLVAPDLLVTAGHCIRDERSCKDTNFVFGFAIDSDDRDPTEVQSTDVYTCKELVESKLERGSNMDWAVIRLDRKVEGRQPLTFRAEGKIADRQDLVVIGHPSGLPTKVAEGAWVRDNSQDVWFSANLDTYGGNSGSAVFNIDTGMVEGILVRGASDFVWDGTCRRTNYCEDDGCMGEEVTRSIHFAETVHQALED